MFRIIYIFFLLSKYSIVFLLSKYKLLKISNQKLLRNFFEESQGAFIKFGQLLALRVDFLSNEYSLELLNLLDNVPSFSYDEAEAVFLQELGASPDKIFKDFQKEPFASASFGQVYGAKLFDDSIVVVKIMRPGIEKKVTLDFFIIDLIAFTLDTFFRVDSFKWREFAGEFKKWTKQELDYKIEAEHGEILLRNNRGNKNTVIPKIHHELTTKRILVEEYIEGIHLSKVIKRLKDGRLNEEKLKDLGVDIKKVPRILIEELLRQFLFYGFFHADPHPGNIIILKNNKIALIDFGIVGKEPISNIDNFLKCIKASINFQYKESAFFAVHFACDELKILLRSAMPATVEQKDIDNLINLLSDKFSENVEKVVKENLENLKLVKKDYTLLFLEILKSAGKYGVKLPKELVIFGRTLAVFGLLAKQLDKDFYISDEIKKFFQNHSEDEFIKDNNLVAVKRIDRELALEKLNNWLSYLLEKDISIYHLVENYLNKYTFVDR